MAFQTRLDALASDAARKVFNKSQEKQGGSKPKLKGGMNTFSRNQSPAILGGIKGGLANAGR